jgi:DNA-binding transcriptional MerR regulator
MRIGELARSVGLKTSAIRYYEQIGLIPEAERSGSGYRQYSEGDVRRLRLIHQARMLSLPLDEIREIVTYAVDGRCAALREELKAALTDRLADTRRQIRELTVLQGELARLCEGLSVAACSPDAAVAPAGACSCLDDLTANDRLALSGPESAKRVNEKGGALMADKPVKAKKPLAKDCGCGCMPPKKNEKKTEAKK